MTDRFNRIRREARQNQVLSPIDYSCISPFALDSFSKLSMPLTREILDSLVRCRATQTHADVTPGREQEIRELSPTFALLRDPSSLKSAVVSHVQEWQGLCNEHSNARRTIGESLNRCDSIREKFHRLHNPLPSGDLPISQGDWTISLLPEAVLQQIIHDPSPEDLKIILPDGKKFRLSGMLQDDLSAEAVSRMLSRVDSLDDVPTKDRKRLYREAVEAKSGVKAELEALCVAYAEEKMEKEFPALRGKYQRAVGAEKPSSAQRKVLARYEELHDRFSSEAMATEPVQAVINDFILRNYRRERKWALGAKHIEDAIEAQENAVAAEQARRSEDLSLLRPQLVQVPFHNGRNTTLGKTERSVVGILSLRIDERDTTFFKEASKTSGCSPAFLLPHMSDLSFTLPPSYLVDLCVETYPEISRYLVTVGYPVEGQARFYLEGQIFGATPVDREDSNSF